jgi:hypothetical protein
MPAGRPTVMTPETVKKLEEAFALGCSDGEACFYADITKKTLYNYQDANPEFIHRKAALKERPVLLARQELIKGLTGNPELALKYLERKRRKEFALRSDITTDDQAIKTATIIDLGNVTNITETESDSSDNQGTQD